MRRGASKLSIFTSTLLLVGWTALSASAASKHSVGVGLYHQGLFSVTTSNDASPSFLGEMVDRPFFSWKSSWPAFGPSHFTPSLSYTLLPKSTKDDAADITWLMLTLPLTQPLSSTWNWSYGITYIRQTIDGNGGTVVLNNGTGTATFYRPTGSSTSTLFSADLGLHWLMDPKYELSFELKSTGLLSSRRSFNFMIAFHYQLFGGGL